ncbi:MAG TPA: hypothetical protein VK555_04110 [Terriglobales bacterium]|jgi:hypothetical protein|nr:hypothetical protein [Terriglobales bacterium]
MSPELETLDQLLGGDLSLALILPMYPSQEAFGRGVLGLLSCGDVVLMTTEGVEVPPWRWRKLFSDRIVFQQLENFRLRITPQGAGKIC